MAAPRKAPKSQNRQTAAIYARVSTAEQRDEGYSLDAQLSLLRSYAHDKGLTIAQEFVEAESAKTAGRTAFRDLVALARAGQVGAILVEKTDRLYRNLKDRVTIDELGVELHFVKEGVILGKDARSHDRFIHDIKVVLAKNYIDNLREEVKKGMLEKAHSGIYPSLAPVGYRNVSRQLEIDPDQAPRVRQLFERYAEGDVSVYELTNIARMTGIVTSKGKPQVVQGVYRMLRNAVYAGRVVWGGVDVEGIHVPIVSRELFDRVQAILGGRGNAKARTEQTFVYKGLLRCVCGCRAAAQVQKGRFIYYSCNGAKGCKKVYIREEVIDELVAKRLEGLHVSMERIDELRVALKDDAERLRLADSADRERLAKDCERLRNRLTKLYTDRVDGEIEEVTYRLLKAQWQGELDQAESKMRQSAAAATSTLDSNLRLLELAGRAAELYRAASQLERAALARSLLSNSILDGKNVDIRLQPWFEYLFEINATSEDCTVWWAQLDSN